MAQGPIKKSNQSISNLTNLANALDVKTSELEEIVNTPFSDRYRKIIIEKSAGGSREVYDPTRPVRKVQKRINKRINKRIFKVLVEWPEYLFGSIPNTIEKNASGVVAQT